MATRKVAKPAAHAAPNPFKPVALGLFLIAALVSGVTVFGNMLDSKAKLTFSRHGIYTVQEVGDAVRELRRRQRDMDFSSPFAPGAFREPESARRVF